MKRVTLYLPLFIFFMIPDSLRLYLYSSVEFFSHKYGANTEQTLSKQQDADVCYYKSKTIRDINTKLSENDNEWY